MNTESVSAADSPAVIDIAGLVKTFGSVRALDGLDLSVRRGQIHGFLGPNGAGKTTTLRAILGLQRPDSGSIQVFGAHPWRASAAVRARIAYVPGEVALWSGLSGGETIDVLGRLRGGYDPQRRDRLVERFELNPRTKVDAYSKGNRQKVALIAALACDVELYLFDEPTDGLDPLMAEVYRDEVRALVGSGSTVLLSSHVLAEVDATCDWVTILRDGKAVETGRLEDLRHLSRTFVSARTERPVDMAGLGGIADLQVSDSSPWTVRCAADADALPAVLARLSDAGVQTLETRPPTLEEMFLRYYERVTR